MFIPTEFSAGLLPAVYYLQVLATFGPAAGAGPVGIVVAVIGALVSIFSAFRGSGLKDVARALNDFRAQASRALDTLMRFAWWIGRALGHLLSAVHKFWVFLVQPMLDQIARIAKRINDIVERVLKPYLDTLQRIRKAIDAIYKTIFRPIIDMLDTVRKIASLGRLLHIKGAANLDRRIARLEGKILEPIRALYRKVSEVGGWMNVLVDARAVLRQAILLGSLYQHRGRILNMHYNSQIQQLSKEDEAAIDAVHQEAAPENVSANMDALLSAGAGRFAEAGARGLAAFEDQTSA